MDKATEREHLLIDTLRMKKKLSTAEVIDLLDVSESTVRRLFSAMEKRGSIVRSYSSVQLSPAMQGGSLRNYDLSRTTHVAEKRAIGNFASSFVENDDVIYLDCGSTTIQFAIALKARLISEVLRGVHVITTSLTILDILNPVCDTTLIGGSFRKDKNDFAGYVTEKFLQTLSFNKSFSGADCFHPRHGFMTTDAETARLIETVISSSAKHFILIDSSKFGSTSFITCASTEDVFAAVTDDGISGNQLELCKNASLNLLVAS